jgi:hypothetical protein
MSIQFQALLSDTLSQLNAQGGGRYTPESSAFTPISIEVLAVDETPPLGDVITPRYAFVRLLSGDDLLVGLEEDDYPFRLTIPSGSAGESMLFRFDVEGIREISTITTIESDNSALDDKYFLLEDRAGEVKVVITTDGVTAITSTGRVVVATIAPGATDDEVADAIELAFASDSELTAVAVDNIVTFTDRHTGERTPAAAGDSGFTAGTTQQGAASPVLHMKSLGTSQVLFAAAPN